MEKVENLFKDNSVFRFSEHAERPEVPEFITGILVYEEKSAKYIMAKILNSSFSSSPEDEIADQ